MTTTAELLAATSATINRIGAGFMLHPDSNAIGERAGFSHPFQFYTAGRGGVLGDVDADVVVSAFGFFAPSLVRKFWESAVSVTTPRQAARLFATSCQEWGRARLDRLDGLARLAELGERVIDDADSAGLALFAGWRAEELPDDDAGRAYQVLHVLREFRGSAHIVAVRAAGLSAFEAKVAKDGAAAKTFGWRDWQEDLLDLEGAHSKLSRAEDLTDQLVSDAFATLSDGERTEFVQLVHCVDAALNERASAMPVR